MIINNYEELILLLKNNEITEHKYLNVELKQTWSQEVGKKFSMLTNSRPNEICYLLVGVNDKGFFISSNDNWLKTNIENISGHINAYLDPYITVLDVKTEKFHDNYVLIIIVKNPGVVVKWNKKAYKGSGTTLDEMEPEEILEMNLKFPGLHDFTKQETIYQSKIQLVELFCNLAKLEYKDNILIKFHLSNNKCGDLLLGTGTYRLIKYNKEDNIISNETRNGLITLLSSEFNAEIRKFYELYLDNTNRISDIILREAIGNCVGHAAYHDNTGEIIIELKHDCLIFSNLVYRDYISLVNKWFSHAHKSPNPFMMETLRFIGKVDELGRGKKRLFSECLMKGFTAPHITITEAGKNKRWQLIIPINDENENYNELKNRLINIYGTEKGLIAYALVLWKDLKFSEIAKYFDEWYSKIATEIIADIKGPVFFWKERDQITLHRWVEVLINEGKASKGFSEYEERQLFDSFKNIFNQFHGGIFSSKQFREFAHMSNSPSDRVLASNVLNKWLKAGKLEKLKRGNFQFIEKTTVEVEKDILKTLIDVFKEAQNFAKSNQ